MAKSVYAIDRCLHFSRKVGEGHCKRGPLSRKLSEHALINPRRARRDLTYLRMTKMRYPDVLKARLAKSYFQSGARSFEN